MTVGKKIGSGFSVILLLTLVLGYLAITDMQEGVQTSKNISEDRVPRFMVASALESNVLEFPRLYLRFAESKNEAEIKALEKQTSTIKGNIAKLRELQDKHPYKGTGAFLEKFPKDLETYLERMRACIALIRKAQENNTAGLKAGKDAEVSLETLIKALGKESRQLMETGQTSLAATYAQHMASVSADLTDVGNLIKKVLTAKSTNDEKLLGEIVGDFKSILANLEKLREKFDRQEYRDLLQNSIAATQNLGREIDQLMEIHGQLAAASKARYDLFVSLKQQTLGLSGDIAANTTQGVNGAEETLSAATTRTIMILIGVIILGIGISLFTTRMIVKPLVTTQVFAKAVANGDLERTLDVHSTDELGMLADDLRQMVTSLKENIDAAQR
ncbi:HAMP domain-containing protein, partial [Desulfovibrio sp. SGI.169]|uniref:HAMP domain-containing protein n=1 Tax=Desulfovibrio sp. SGI.169 TaxID=3420561 RepID=UPI003CFE7E9B